MGYVLTVILLGANMPTSVYGLYRTEFGFTPTIQTLIYGVYVAGLVPALLFFGPLSDALGRRTVLLTALALRERLNTRGDRRVTGEEWVNSW